MKMQIHSLEDSPVQGIGRDAFEAQLRYVFNGRCVQHLECRVTGSLISVQVGLQPSSR